MVEINHEGRSLASVSKEREECISERDHFICNYLFFFLGIRPGNRELWSSESSFFFLMLRKQRYKYGQKEEPGWCLRWVGGVWYGTKKFIWVLSNQSRTDAGRCIQPKWIFVLRFGQSRKLKKNMQVYLKQKKENIFGISLEARFLF